MPSDKRARSQWGDDERAEVGARHRTPRAGVEAAPVAVDDDDSTAYAVPERQERRERRTTPNRIRKLEAFKDDMLERVPRIETNVQWLVERKKEEIEEKRLAADIASRAATNQVGLEKVRITSRTRVAVAIIGLISAILGIAGTLLVKAVS